MLVDDYLKFSAAQALTATAASTNYADLTTTSRKLGVGEPMALVVTVDTAADSTTGDETYAVAIQTDDNTSFSSATTVVSKTITAANLTAGSQHVIPVDFTTFERYTRAYYTLGGTTPSVTVTAYLTPLKFIGEATVYPDGITIS